jgi:type II secretory pathway predicted ATPase ExeA
VTEAAILEDQSFLELSKWRDNPFSRTAGADHPYLSSSFRQALASVYYELECGARILLLSADPGFGKTTLLRQLRRRLQPRGRTLFMSSGARTASEMLRELFLEIGGAAAGELQAIWLEADAVLPSVAGADNPFTLLLDYEERSAGPALEIVRHLTNLESFKRGLLRIVIALPNLIAEELQGAEFEDFRRVLLGPLTAVEVESYIDHRLRSVGWSGGPLFTTQAYASIAQRSSGTPAAIDEICSKLLQKLSETGNGVSDRPDHNQELPLDESYLDRVLAGRDSSAETLPFDDTAPQNVRFKPSLNRTSVTIAATALILLISIAGVWYRTTTTVDSAKHVRPTITSPFATTQRHTIFHNRTLARFANPTHAMSSSDVKEVSANPAMETGSGRTDDVNRLSGVASRAASARPAPAAEKVPISSMPSSSSFSKTDSTRRVSASSSPNSLNREPHLAVARALPVTPGEDTEVATPTAKEMANYEVRLGDAYMNMGEYDKAVLSFSKAVALAPNDKEAQEKVMRARRAKAVEENVLQ